MYYLKAISICICVLCSLNGFSQSKFDKFLKPSDSLNTNRKRAVIISEISIVTATLIGLDRLWYKDFQRSSFKTANDNDEWLQVDKIGHSFSSYHLTRLGAETMAWSGANKKAQLINGAALSLGFLTTVEIFDGFSEEWGFSWGDMAANFGGTGLYVGQELLWQEQRISLKYSFHRTSFANQNPDKLGSGLLEEALKDYNGQTYWLSGNLYSFFKESKLPKWLNLAIGYGGEGMLSARENTSILFPNQQHTRQFYLSLDVDLTKIPTKSRVLSTIFSIVNTVKIPAPTLEISGKRGIAFHLLYF
ncbi:DUF2279 domain-containing protein [Ichthyenterobacterium sp. W332]|uniref:DUF2279 domain-containing protein n=1 Tax=Microcosmobacter mediterraneus TaxID=3075607 RepID=A0ABU2YH61_9FLAO|nr:DUF2279 domain-containing protein [Ichthyenterobacterium sp. W332]MDT0557514.1 DUF2279 domain-containing protein [Ichthyenterobacterium sp. W332]